MGLIAQITHFNPYEERTPMLVLSRKPGERITIGPEIVVTINRIGRSHVVVGVDAPKEVKVDRRPAEPARKTE